MASHDDAGKKVFKTDELSDKAFQFINDVNDWRRKDMALLEELRSLLLMEVENICSRVEQYMYKFYENQNRVLKEKMQALYDGLTKVATMEEDLALFKEDVIALHSEL